MRLVLASRKSDLARIQAHQVGQVLSEAFPQLEIIFHFRESLGDKNLTDPLWKMPEKGVFTQDFYEDLMAEKVDLVVHSWKDLPIEQPPGTEIVATLKREDCRDLLLIKKGVRAHSGLKIFSSSPRREHNLQKSLKDLLPFETEFIGFEPIRGNIPTRIDKWLKSDHQGLVLAKAAVDRILTSSQEEFRSAREVVRSGLKASHWMVLPISINPAAAAQGALAIEIKSSRTELKKLLTQINSPSDFEDVMNERRILKSHGGGCHLKIGVTQRTHGFGVLTTVRGVDPQGRGVDCDLFSTNRNIEKSSTRSSWPVDLETPQWDRIPLVVKKPKNCAFWVSRAEAWPVDWDADWNDQIWVAGLKTWKRLAARGVWVAGSSDGLGEITETPLKHWPDGDLDWIKLGHGEGYIQEGVKLLPTYELKLNKWPSGDLNEKTNFYWSSGSTFLEAVRRFPEIRSRRHCCGPGNTYRVISDQLGQEQRPEVFPSYEAWLELTVSK
ncbi:MAG: hydroxymethylbilane synthase [Oligoflexia bacterium]|nr:hydroxymethylbilane synthase [Oligoflexia bacterium]